MLRGQLRAWAAGNAKVLLRDTREPVDLSFDCQDKRKGLLLANVLNLFLEQLDIEADGRQRVSNLVGDVGSHLSDGGEALRLH